MSTENRFKISPSKTYIPPNVPKKDISKPLAKEHDPKDVESGWAGWWESQQFFKPDLDSTRPSFVIATPPPNVTGILHIGHALGTTIQDILSRWKRMQGFNVAWIPGTDHAGIATQTVVERSLKAESGRNRNDMPREEFISLCWNWVAEKGGEICNQFREMGLSYDWSREVFTMDDLRTHAVLESFIRLYEKGLIVRRYRLINWDPTLQSSISDIEVDYKNCDANEERKVPGYDKPVRFGYFTLFSYIVEGASPDTDRSDERLYVATTRLETMLGDTAVAINPNDPDYKCFLGKRLVHPFRNVSIPVVADDYVDPSYGTGAVKITPAHDPHDWEIGQRHNLEVVNVMSDDGTMNDVVPEFAGQKRYDARETIKASLIQKGFIGPVKKMSAIPNNTATREDGVLASAEALLRKRLQQSGMIGDAEEVKEEEADGDVGDSSAAKKKRKFKQKANEQKTTVIVKELSPEAQAELNETECGPDFGHAMSLTVCSRSQDIIEPRLKFQWFLNCSGENGLAVGAKDAVVPLGSAAIPEDQKKQPTDGTITISPPSYKAVWDTWFNNMQDWCISRQLWWGHQIPAFRATRKGTSLGEETTETKWYVALTKEEALAKAAQDMGIGADEIEIIQDEDVLDTWFSSGLFPFSIMDWPADTPEMKKLFPTSVMETGNDIIFFWVARMVMMSLTLTGQVPFTHIYLHSLIRDKNGRKMSKSLGNIIDPRDVIEGRSLKELEERAKSSAVSDKEIKVAIESYKKDYPKGIERCGVDALRLTLAGYLRQDSDINLNLDVVKSWKQFCNKLWQMTRFALTYIPSDFVPLQADISPGPDAYTATEPIPHALDDVLKSPCDRWMLHRIHNTLTTVHETFSQYAFGKTVEALRMLIYDDFCDRYLESVKGVLQADEALRKKHQKEGTSAAPAAGGELSEADQVRQVLYEVVDVSLRVLHPFIPFETEELWQHIPRRAGDRDTICLASFPIPQHYACFSKPNGISTEVLDASHTLVFNTISNVRSLRATFKVKPSSKSAIAVGYSEASADPLGPSSLISTQSALLQTITARYGRLCNVKTLNFLPEPQQKPEDADRSGAVISDGLTVFLRLRKGSSTVNFGAEAQRLLKQAEKTSQELQKLEKQMDQVDKMPAQKAEDMRQKIRQKTSEVESLKTLSAQFGGLAAMLVGEDSESESSSESEELDEEKKKEREEKKKLLEEKKAQKLLEKKEKREREEKEREEKEKLKAEKKAAKDKQKQDKKNKETEKAK